MTEPVLDNPENGPSVENNIINAPIHNVSAPQTWPDNWRSEMAGGDEKYLKQLERFNSPPDVFKSYREVQAKLSGQKPVVEKPGADAAPEAIKAYRDSLGIPDDPSGYDLTFDDGTVINDTIKSQLDGYLQFAHENNLPPDVVKGNLSWFIRDVAAQQEKVAALNDEARINGITDLKKEWGGEFQGNMNAIHSLFTSAPEGTMDALLNSSGPDGLKFANNPNNIRWLASLAKELNPQATLVPPGPDQAASIDSEITKITALMNSKDRSERDRYWKDEKMQARFAQLNMAKQGR